LTYVGERADVQALEHLEAILRNVADELAAWRARALKAESELKELHGRGGGGGAAEARNRIVELESENKVLRQRVEGARLRVNDLLSRLTFLDDQVRESGNGGGGGGAK